MTIRKFLVTIGLVNAALAVLAVAYVMFGDLSRHEARIEKIVSERLGRAFAIDGAFELEIYPVVRIVAEDVRIANADWGRDPAMLEVGHFETEIDTWSLLSGPVDVHVLDVRHVTVRVESQEDGRRNWDLGGDRVPERPGSGGAKELPVVFRHAEVSGLVLSVRAPGRPERQLRVDSMTVDPDADGFLEIAGNGSVNDDRFRLQGTAGPLPGLLAGEDIRLDLEGSLDRFTLAARGSIGRLDPLDGFDLELRAEDPAFDRLLERLGLPVVLTGELDIDGHAHDTGDLTEVHVAASVGRNRFQVDGTLAALEIPGSKLRVSADVPDIARAARAFGVEDLPPGTLEFGGGVPPAEVPPLSVSAHVSSTGRSPHELAAGANGRILLSQGEGKVRSGALALFAGDTLTELLARLNPFAEKDPYTVIDCMVVRADIRDGHDLVEPVLMQGSKITVMAQGTVDLESETLLFDFNTRPRKGLGISPGMITNPFVRLQGTLVSPAIGVGKKGFAMGALAAATGGASVLAEGLLDRARGEADLCAETLALARR